MNYRLIDGKERNLLNPNTFEIPTDEEINDIKVDDSVKVGVEFLHSDEGERFWVTITKINGNSLEGKIDNDLLLTDTHGLSDGDVIVFQKQNILSIYGGW